MLRTSLRLLTLLSALALVGAACGGPRNPAPAAAPVSCEHYAVFVTNNADLAVDVHQGSELIGTVSPRTRQDLPLPSGHGVSWTFAPVRPLATADTVDARAFNRDVHLDVHCR